MLVDLKEKLLDSFAIKHLMIVGIKFGRLELCITCISCGNDYYQPIPNLHVLMCVCNYRDSVYVTIETVLIT